MNQFYLNGELIEYQIHPIATCPRPFTEEEFKGLKEHIDRVGLLMPIHYTVDDGEFYLLDGRHRLKALEEIHGEIPFLGISQVVSADIDPNDYMAVDDYIIGLHEKRRENTIAQKNEELRKRRKLLEDNNEERRLEGNKKGGLNKSAHKRAQTKRDRSKNTVNQLAKNDGRSVGTIKRIHAVDKHGSELVKKKMDEGTISPSLAEDLVKTFPSHEDQNELVELDKQEIRIRINKVMINEEVIRKVKEALKRQAEEDKKIAEEVKRGNEQFMERLKEAHGDSSKVVKILSMSVDLGFKTEYVGIGGASFEIKDDKHINQIIEILKSIVPSDQLDFSNMDLNK